MPEAYEVQGMRRGTALVMDRKYQQLAEAEQPIREEHRQQLRRQLSDPTHGLCTGGTNGSPRHACLARASVRTLRTLAAILRDERQQMGGTERLLDIDSAAEGAG